jgi:hypothetical protein
VPKSGGVLVYRDKSVNCLSKKVKPSLVVSRMAWGNLQAEQVGITKH